MGLITCSIVLDILEGQKRQGWGSTVGDPKSSRKSSRKQQHTKQEKQHKEAEAAQTTEAQRTGAAQAEASCTNNKEHQSAATQEKSTKRISKSSKRSSKSSNRDTRAQKAGTEGLFVLSLASSRVISVFPVFFFEKPVILKIIDY